MSETKVQFHMYLLKLPSTAPKDAPVMYIFLPLIVPLIQFEFTFPYEDLLSQSLELSPPRYGRTWGNEPGAFHGLYVPKPEGKLQAAATARVIRE